jgi:protein O-mannosyl-transferase
MPGLMLFIPVLLLRFLQRRTLLALGCIAIVLVPLAWNRLWVFGDNYRLWNDAALLLKNERVAGADRIYYNRGQALMEVGKWEEAIKDLERSAAISPQLEPVRYLLGQAYSNAGRYEEALLQFDAAIDIKADEGQVYFSKGVALTRLHRKDEAKREFEQGCKLNVLVACVMNMPPNNKLKK